MHTSELPDVEDEELAFVLRVRIGEGGGLAGLLRLLSTEEVFFFLRLDLFSSLLASSSTSDESKFSSCPMRVM